MFQSNGPNVPLEFLQTEWKGLLEETKRLRKEGAELRKEKQELAMALEEAVLLDPEQYRNALDILHDALGLEELAPSYPAFLLYNAACVHLAATVEALAAAMADRALAIQQRDAVIARELRRQERARAPRYIAVAPIRRGDLVAVKSFLSESPDQYPEGTYLDHLGRLVLPEE